MYYECIYVLWIYACMYYYYVYIKKQEWIPRYKRIKVNTPVPFNRVPGYSLLFFYVPGYPLLFFYVPHIFYM